MLSNLALIREFITQSIAKKEVLLANSALQAQMVYKSNQLIAKKEGIIATTQLNTNPSDFLIASPSSYWDVMNETLADYSYIFTGEVDRLGFYKYQQCSVPQGYQLRCTTSVNLWQNWWKYRKTAFNSGIPLDILIRTRDSWYGIKDLFISDGLIYIKTLVSEMTVHSNDLVIWLSKNELESQA
ncbi:hypothetical protein [Nostoc parmelioides]|uniref:Uncharacterized protein n=1 Tax=Nostoc parmelioides FACHB-3921 TaxID=2692909 RepID=A0ABR8BBS9_9NOSO|nr:hypothetical protein [Nostoc parmelioides]MBD2251235.1 hypothetical protein [Nostoc parmelioides FACHB-3921]